MSRYLPVQHPLDTAAPEFDFWGWRLQRRFLVDRLIALSQTENPTVSEALRQVAREMETESLGKQAADWLLEYVEAYGYESGNVRTLLLSCSRMTISRGVTPTPHWKMPAIVPDWNEIQPTRARLMGTADGINVTAQLAPSIKALPPYEIVWPHSDGAAADPRANGSPVMHLAPAIWDWLLARRLTILAQMGQIPWPEPTEPPLWTDWPELSRPF